MNRQLFVLAVLVAVAALLLPRASSTAAPNLAPAAAKTKCSSGLIRVRFIQGGLEVKAPKKAAAKGKVNERLAKGSTLRTGKEQRASICFKDGTILNLNAQTEVVVKSSTVTVVNRGEVEEVYAPGTERKIRTRTAVATASEGRTDVKYEKVKKSKTATEKVNQTKITVAEGAVVVAAEKKKVVVKTGEQVAVREKKAPGSVTKADAAKVIVWTHPIPAAPASLGLDVALDANGGALAGVSSTRASPEGTWDPGHLIDGNPDTGWQSAQGATTNQWVEVALPAGALYRVTELVLNCAATGGESSANDMRDFDVRFSTSDTRDSSFSTIASFTCQQSDKLQVFVIPGQPAGKLRAHAASPQARYVEVFAKSNYGGSDGIAIKSIQVISPDRPPVLAVATATPILPTSTPIPASTSVPTVTPRPTATNTPLPAATSTSTATSTATSMPLPTAVPLSTETPTPVPKNTSIPPTATPCPVGIRRCP